MNKGRIVYYDTRDGEMLLNTGYIEDYTNSDVVEKYYMQLEEQFGNRNYISHKFLGYMEYDEEFNKFVNVRVIPSGELFFSMKESKYRLGLKHTMTDRWWPLFEKASGMYDETTGAFDGGKLKYYYKDFIEYNLRNVCRVVDTYWLLPTEIRRMNDSNEHLVVYWNEEPFPSKEEFAEELLSEGFVMPLQSKVKEDGMHYIFDGSHRIISCRMLVEDGRWPTDRKILTLRFNTTNVNFIENEMINYELPEVVKMHIPKVLMDKYHFLKYKDIREFDENIYELDIYRYLDMVILFRMYVTELTRPLRRYKVLTGKTLKPSPIIENKEVFDKWMTGEIDIWDGYDE